MVVPTMASTTQFFHTVNTTLFLFNNESYCCIATCFDYRKSSSVFFGLTENIVFTLDAGLLARSQYSDASANE